MPPRHHAVRSARQTSSAIEVTSRSVVLDHAVIGRDRMLVEFARRRDRVRVGRFARVGGSASQVVARDVRPAPATACVDPGCERVVGCPQTHDRDRAEFGLDRCPQRRGSPPVQEHGSHPMPRMGAHTPHRGRDGAVDSGERDELELAHVDECRAATFGGGQREDLPPDGGRADSRRAGDPCHVGDAPDSVAGPAIGPPTDAADPVERALVHASDTASTAASTVRSVVSSTASAKLLSSSATEVAAFSSTRSGRHRRAR